MIHDQHENSLKAYYGKVLAATRAYLESRYAIEDGSKGDKDVEYVSQLNPHATVCRITGSGTERSFTLLVAIPPTFPDNLPKFYLREKDFLDFGPLPHVDGNRFVCTRDPATVVLNDMCPGEAFEKLLQIAIEIIEAGIEGKLKQDFEDEFLAYWNDRAVFQTILIGPVPKTPCVMTQYEVTPRLFGGAYLIALSKNEAITWLARLDTKTKLRNPTKVICIQLPKVPASVPMTNQDIKALIDGLDNTSMNCIKHFHGSDLLARVPSNQDFLLFSWRHTLLPVRGFRNKPGSAPLYLTISNPKSKHANISKLHVRRFDRDRLIRRTVDMSVITGKDFKLAIVGCGSVGSTLAMLLAKSGCAYFTLVDPEALTEENVARHLCGCSAMVTTSKKIQAVKHALASHLPFVSCDVHDKDVLEILMTKPQVFDDVQLMLIATANMGIERRVNDFFVLERPKPTIYIWLEPYGVAGHMLYISPSSGGCYRCCFNSYGNFHFAVAENSQDFDKREAGCQQTFTPYGAADLELFCAMVCKEIIHIFQELPAASYLMTWIGDKEQFQSAGHRIKDDYSAHDSYSIKKRDIHRQGTCELCSKRT